MMKKIFVFIFACLSLMMLTERVYATDTDTSGKDSGTQGPGSSQTCSSGCWWSNDVNMYMFDLVKKDKNDTNYTRIASAVVGDVSDIKSKIKNKTIQFSKDEKSRYNENIKTYTVSGTESEVKNIKGLGTLAKYLNSHDNVNAIGTKLTDEQICGMLNDFGVSTKYDKKSKTCQLKKEYQSSFNIQQSKDINGSTGYRILIQVFNKYTTKCCNAEANSHLRYLLRKESDTACDWTNSSDGHGKELFLPEKVLGITKYNKGNDFPKNAKQSLRKKMNGAGYNAIWFVVPFNQYQCKQVGKTMNCKIQKKNSKTNKWEDITKNYNPSTKKWVEVKEFPCNGIKKFTHRTKKETIKTEVECPEPDYTCVYNGNDKCMIKAKVGKSSWTESKEVACNGQKKYGGKTLKSPCPKITAECTDTNKYGRCIITKKAGNQVTGTKEVDCNAYSTHPAAGGTDTYKGIKLSPVCKYYPKYNYDIDAVCENCDSTTTNGSYQVQDVVDWEAIIHSRERNDKPDSLQKYYDKGNGVLCRDEFNVEFPNANSVKDVKIDAGRYFTVDEKGSMYINGIYNFSPIKVTRTRQCISTNGIDSLKNYTSTHNINDLGEASLTYKENMSGSQYFHDKKNPLTLKANETRTKKYASQESTITAEGKQYPVIVDKTDAYFNFDKDVYRYVSSKTGKSELNTPAETKHYTDLKTSSLPISRKNTNGAEIGLYYSLPSSSQLFKVIESGKANYLEERPTIDNVYTRKINPNETACAKMYGLSTAQYTNCVNERNKSKTDVSAANKCLAQLGPNSKANEYTYTCKIQSKEPDDNDNTCYPLATSEGQEQMYMCKDGTICNAAKYAEQCGKKCVVTGGKYYGQTGDEVSKEEYEIQCPARVDCEIKCPECGYCCPDTTMMCAVKDENGKCGCPAKGGNKIIYRPIDLTNPFPGQTNYQRATGANWCYKPASGPVKCNNENFIVKKHITNNRNTANESIYQLQPLYTVELNAENIKKIRKYNETFGKENDYQDFKLTCKQGVCVSNEFLRNSEYSLQLSGVCGECGSSDFTCLRNCAERRQ